MSGTAALDHALDLLAPGMTVFLSGTSGESLAFREALSKRPGKAAGVRFVGVFFPGINDHDYLAADASTTLRAYFAHAHLREGWRGGRVELMALDYPGIWDDLERLPIDLALVQCSPADARGRFTLGICHDFAPAIWARAAERVVHVNPLMPRTEGPFSVAPGDCTLVCEQEAPLVEVRGGDPGPELLCIGDLVADIVQEGDTVQLGIGKMQGAVVRALRRHRRLRIHSGMVSEEIAGLLSSGVVDGPGSVTTGVALGDQAFYRGIEGDERFRFLPVAGTHDVRALARIGGFVSINAAVEVDLLGQVNCECLDGRLLAGVGGMPAFMAGARLAERGRSVFCLAATARRGTVSRIVPRLGDGGTVAVPRHAVDYVVTEHGSVSLAGLPVRQRAAKLISIAAPEFRESLEKAWHEEFLRL